MCCGTVSHHQHCRFSGWDRAVVSTGAPWGCFSTSRCASSHLSSRVLAPQSPCAVPSFHSLHLHQHHSTGSQHPPLLIHTPGGQTPASSCHRGTFLSPVPSMDLPEQAMTGGAQQLLLSRSLQIPGIFGQCHDGEGLREERLFTFASPVQEAS